MTALTTSTAHLTPSSANAWNLDGVIAGQVHAWGICLYRFLVVSPVLLWLQRRPVKARMSTMRIEYLSDHVGELLHDTQLRTREKIQEANRWLAERHRAEADLRSAAKPPWWRRLLRWPAAEAHQSYQRIRQANRHLRSVDAERATIESEIEQIRAGKEGEEDLVHLLGEGLSDRWMCFCGYRNGKGETDLLVVGPSAIWVVEVKNRAVTLSAHGDRWTFQKFDRAGKVVEVGPATDSSGRSWGRQASEVGDALATWLSRNHYEPPIRSAVVIVNDRSLLGAITEPGVDLVTTKPSELVRVIGGGHGAISRSDQAAIEALVRRDHRFHQQRRARRHD